MERTDEPGRGRRRRPQHLLHPPERRRQALRAPRASEVGPGATARACRSPSAAASPRRTASCSSQRAPYVDAVFGTHNVGRVAALLGLRPRPRASRCSRCPTRRRGTKRPTSPQPWPSATTSPTPPGSRSRWGATIRVHSASCPRCGDRRPSRPFGELVGEIEALAARRDIRGHAARPERQLLRPRPDDQVARRRRGRRRPAPDSPATDG